MDDRAEVGQCAHQIGIDRDLAGIDNRPDRIGMRSTEIRTFRLNRQHQCRIFRCQRIGDRRRNSTNL